MNVTVYTTSTCPWCVRVKEYLRSSQISFVEKNVGMNREAAKEMIQKTGQMGVPVIDINGNMVVGFDKDRIDSLLGIQ